MKNFGLIGKNIDYSFSRVYFTEKFERETINAKYQNFDLETIEEFPSILKTPNLTGMNVTIPYKEAVIPFLDKLAEDAEEIGAVNVIKPEKDGSLTGHNTDYIGFLESLKPHLKPHHEKALVLGTGGAAKAVEFALHKLGIEPKLVSRKPVEKQFSYTDLTAKVLQKYTLIVNTTPVGTFPNYDKHPDIPFEYLDEKHLIYDLIYNPETTRLMELAKEKGAWVTNGQNMLELQAEAAWEIWNS